MKRFLIIMFFLSSVLLAQMPKFGEVKGLFLSAGVGPKLPVGSFSNTNNPGGGFDLALSYTDNVVIPFFLNVSVGYTHFPGSQDFYAVSDHSAFSSNVITATLGIRYYLPPLMEKVVLVMPVIDCSFLYANINDYHQFKPEFNKPGFNDKYSKYGFQAGAGISMFMFDIMAYYNYLPGHNYFSFDIRGRIPIFVSM